MAIRPLAVLALTLCLGLGIGPASAAHTVSDDSGRQVTVRAPPLRIVSLTPGATAMLFAALKRTYGTGGAGRAPAVLLQVWNRPIYTVGGRHLMSDALEICGARNVLADLPEAGPLVDTEAVIARDPDMIIAAAPPGEGAAWLADWKRFPTLAAVRSGRLGGVEDHALSRLGPSVIDASEALCRTLAP